MANNETPPNASDFMKTTMSFFAQLRKGEGLGLNDEQKELLQAELKRQGGDKLFDKLQEDISQLAGK